MSYSEFTSIIKVKQAFGLTTVEGPRFLPQITPIAPSATLTDFLANSLPVAVATGSEKARSEMIITPVLLEVRKILQQNISLFSGEDFTVDYESGLNGICDYLISRSPKCWRLKHPQWRLLRLKKLI